VSYGDTLICQDYRSEWGDAQSGGMFISVLEDSGRYTFGFGACCGSGPSITDYGPDATCRDLSSAPAGSNYSSGLEYRMVVNLWMARGLDPRLDEDGDGRPCEEYYPVVEIDDAMTSTLQPTSGSASGGR
jgi:hypothetical protein